MSENRINVFPNDLLCKFKQKDFENIACKLHYSVHYTNYVTGVWTRFSCEMYVCLFDFMEAFKNNIHSRMLIFTNIMS